MPIPSGMGTHSEASIYRRGEFFDRAFGIFPAQTRVGNGLTVSERLTADDFCVPSRRKLSAIIPAIAVDPLRIC